VSSLLDEGVPLFPQWAARPAGVLSGLQNYHVFAARPTYQRLARLPLEARAAAMSEPAIRAAILEEDDVPSTSNGFMDNYHRYLAGLLGDTYPMTDPIDYEPDRSQSVVCQAEASDRDAFELVYDLMLEEAGRGMLMVISTNYLDGDLRLTEEMLSRPDVFVGLGDAGAHVRMICDGSVPTYLLTHWARDRKRGRRLRVEEVVKKQSHDTAALFGLRDRGVIAVGYRADVNVIDWSDLALGRPYLVEDLPAGGWRLLQDARGYALTTVAGVPIIRDDCDTGARPGRLVRSPGESRQM
jgi:N-acyl-D-aspartate/D-glutamate deacylase